MKYKFLKILYKISKPFEILCPALELGRVEKLETFKNSKLMIQEICPLNLRRGNRIFGYWFWKLQRRIIENNR